ncbi:hypothetical protein [Aeromicrobium sp.]|uniref:hypothetical protein n=1 Tax=Aeromicrobium sp. TaxID=1871063 RepID=UPI001998A194|nr:hypothetical protein [Aeromicrobium sp.]MBC7630327.1 hypothetical protein [Aeromicrobium sp.]
MRADEWSLTYPGTEIVFGSYETPIFNMTTPSVSDSELRVADGARARTDGVSFGSDFRGGHTIAFELGVRGNGEADVRANVAAVARAWRADTIRSTPGAVAELRSNYAGRELVSYGRPRRFEPNQTSAKSGLSTVVADFACVDDVFYGATVNDVYINFVPSASGGLIAPLASPLSTTESSDRSIGLTVDSDLPVWPVVTIFGPITNPIVEVVGLFRFELNHSLNHDETIVIDTRSWKRTVILNGIGSIPGHFFRTSTRLSKASIPPGSYELALRGLDVTGTSHARLSWQSAHPSI